MTARQQTIFQKHLLILAGLSMFFAIGRFVEASPNTIDKLCKGACRNIAENTPGKELPMCQCDIVCSRYEMCCQTCDSYRHLFPFWVKDDYLRNATVECYDELTYVVTGCNKKEEKVPKDPHEDTRRQILERIQAPVFDRSTGVTYKNWLSYECYSTPESVPVFWTMNASLHFPLVKTDSMTSVLNMLNKITKQITYVRPKESIHSDKFTNQCIKVFGGFDTPFSMALNIKKNLEITMHLSNDGEYTDVICDYTYQNCRPLSNLLFTVVSNNTPNHLVKKTVADISKYLQCLLTQHPYIKSVYVTKYISTESRLPSKDYHGTFRINFAANAKKAVFTFIRSLLAEAIAFAYLGLDLGKSDEATGYLRYKTSREGSSHVSNGIKLLGGPISISKPEPDSNPALSALTSNESFPKPKDDRRAKNNNTNDKTTPISKVVTTLVKSSTLKFPPSTDTSGNLANEMSTRIPPDQQKISGSTPKIQTTQNSMPDKKTPQVVNSTSQQTFSKNHSHDTKIPFTQPSLQKHTTSTSFATPSTNIKLPTSLTKASVTQESKKTETLATTTVTNDIPTTQSTPGTRHQEHYTKTTPIENLVNTGSKIRTHFSRIDFQSPETDLITTPLSVIAKKEKERWTTVITTTMQTEIEMDYPTFCFMSSEDHHTDAKCTEPVEFSPVPVPRFTKLTRCTIFDFNDEEDKEKGQEEQGREGDGVKGEGEEEESTSSEETNGFVNPDMNSQTDNNSGVRTAKIHLIKMWALILLQFVSLSICTDGS